MRGYKVIIRISQLPNREIDQSIDTNAYQLQIASSFGILTQRWERWLRKAPGDFRNTWMPISGSCKFTTVQEGGRTFKSRAELAFVCISVDNFKWYEDADTCTVHPGLLDSLKVPKLENFDLFRFSLFLRHKASLVWELKLNKHFIFTTAIIIIISIIIL